MIRCLRFIGSRVSRSRILGNGFREGFRVWSLVWGGARSLVQKGFSIGFRD